MKNANDRFRHCNGTEEYHRHMGLLITDGVKEFCETLECFWLLDVVASYQFQLRKQITHDRQYWKIEKPSEEASTAVVSCWSMPNTSRDSKLLIKQEIAFTTFPDQEGHIWVKDGVALLPSED